MKIRGIVILLAVFLSLVASAFASSSIGVSPPSQQFFMLPGESYTGQLNVMYYEPYESEARVFATGSVGKYITIEQPEITIPAGGPAPSVKYTIDIPEDTGGKYNLKGDIRIELQPPKGNVVSGGSTGAYAAIGSLVAVSLPREGRYLSAKMRPVKNVNVGEIVYFTMDLQNLGTDLLEGIEATVTIYDAQDQVVTVVKTGQTNLATGDIGHIFAYWETEGILPSFYRAEFEIEYGGKKPATGKADFLVGDLVVKVLDVQTNTTNRDVAKFDIDIQSLWNAEIRNVYGEIRVTNSTNKEVGTVKTTLENLVPRGSGSLVAFLESGHLAAGEYSAELTVFYESKTAEKIFGFELTGEKLREEPKLSAKVATFFSGTNVLLIVLILLLANLFIFLLFSRKRDDKRRGGGSGGNGDDPVGGWHEHSAVMQHSVPPQMRSSAVLEPQPQSQPQPEAQPQSYEPEATPLIQSAMPRTSEFNCQNNTPAVSYQNPAPQPSFAPQQAAPLPPPPVSHIEAGIAAENAAQYDSIEHNAENSGTISRVATIDDSLKRLKEMAKR